MDYCHPIIWVWGMLLENIQKINEDSVYGSLDYVVSTFILSHIYEIKQYSLGDIARTLGLSKSSVASFFQNSKLPGGYPAFVIALDTEIGMRSVSLASHIQWINDFINKIPRRINPVSDEDIGIMAEAMVSSRRIIVIGPMRYRSSMLSLLNLLWYIGIPCRYIISGSVSKYDAELKSLDDSDLTVFLSPYDELTEIRFKYRSFPQISSTLTARTGRRLYICSGNNNSADNEQMIRFTAPRNPYESSAAMDLLAARLFLAVTEIRKMDLNQEIYIS